MLAVLKELDEEYKAPAGFKEKVMARVTSACAENNSPRSKQKKWLQRRYVITGIASAAVIILACVVTMKNGKIDRKSIQKQVADTIVPNEAASESMLPLVITEGNETQEEANLAVPESFFLEQKSSVAESSSVKEESLDSAMQNATAHLANDVMITADKAEEVAGEDKSALRSVSNFSEKLMVLLTEKQIDIVEQEENYVIVKWKLEEAKEVLQELKEQIKIEEIEAETLRISW